MLYHFQNAYAYLMTIPTRADSTWAKRRYKFISDSNKIVMWMSFSKAVDHMYIVFVYFIVIVRKI